MDTSSISTQDNFKKKTWRVPQLSVRAYACLLLIASLARILINLRIPYFAYLDQYYDDTIMLRNAYSLADGAWLGDYDFLTLSKGVGYPLFLALCRKLLLPYSVALALLQIGAAFSFVRAISLKFPNRLAQFLVFALLLFSPITLTKLVTQRLYRMAIIPGMVLLVFSGCIGMTLRKTMPLRDLLPWSVLSALSLSYFWTIREDSIWILPFVIIITIWNIGCLLLSLRKEFSIKQATSWTLRQSMQAASSPSATT